ncbi:MAG TPA: hypothetical protein VJ183_09445 [Chloroflexia bacterium]|nr:hypothetical protein [Chloroflexia bacterium]
MSSSTSVVGQRSSFAGLAVVMARLSSLRVVTHAGVLAFFTLVTIVATWPMLPQLGGYVIDKGDPLYSVWAMAWQGHALITDPLQLFDANVLYPFKGTLAFDELSFAEAVLAAPFYWLLGNPVLSHNIVLFATFALSGYAVWLLVRELTGSGWAGLVGGAAFAFSFYRLNHLPHMTLISTQWLPLVLLSAYKLLWTRKWKWAWALGGFFTLQALSGHYLAFYTAMALGLLFVFYFLVERKLFSWAVIGKVAAGLGVSLLVMLPILVPYVQLQGAQEFKRSLFEAERFSNTLASFLAVFRGNPIYQTLLAPFADPGFWAIERSAFPGLAVLVLGVLGCVWAWRGRQKVEGRGQKAEGSEQKAEGRRQRAGDVYIDVDVMGELDSNSIDPKLQKSEIRNPKSEIGKHAAFYAILALLSALLSLGPSLQITYAPSNYDPEAIQRIIPLPYEFLHDWVPGFQSMRVVTRIGVLTALALSVLAGIGAYFVLRWLRGRLRGHAGQRFALPAVAVVLALLPVFESWSAPVAMSAVGTRDAVPPVYRWLGTQPRTVIVEYPMAHYKRGDINVEMANLYQYYSAYHWHYTVNGSTTIRPFSYSALVLETEKCFPCPRSLDALWALGVEYVVVHLENLSDPQRTDFLWRSTNPAGKVVESFKLVQDFGSDKVYRLEPREVGQLQDIAPKCASLLLADPADDPERQEGELVYGGYVATLGYMLRDRAQYSADTRVNYSQPVSQLDLQNPPECALLWAEQDPAMLGYSMESKLWANEFVALYRRASPGGRSAP